MNRKIFSDSPRFLSCDWGTSSFRLKLADAHTGRVLAGLASSQGASLPTPAGSRSRPHRNERDSQYRDYLSGRIAELARRSGADPAGAPMILSGMVTSTIGWKELPYARVPLSLEDPVLELEFMEAGRDFPHPVLLVSGVSSDRDVMRGEEVQLLGLHGLFNLEKAVYILPGTHSKHLFMEHGTLSGFSTWMTGELFGLLSTKSILRHSVAGSRKQPLPDSGEHPSAASGEEQASAGDPNVNGGRPEEPGRSGTDGAVSGAFARGVSEALDGRLLQSLFSIRAADLLGSRQPVENGDFLSGLLIGTELQGLNKAVKDGRTVVLAGDSRLQERYSGALDRLGIPHLKSPEEMDLTLSGHRRLIQRLSGR